MACRLLAFTGLDRTAFQLVSEVFFPGEWFVNLRSQLLMSAARVIGHCGFVPFDRRRRGAMRQRRVLAQSDE
jgi:hypothetical protein